MKRLSSKNVSVAVIALSTTVALVGCSQEDSGNGEVIVGVAATPAASPIQKGDPAGIVQRGAAVTGLVSVGDHSVAALSSGTLSIGDPAEVARGTAKTFTVDDSCSSISGTATSIIVTCGESVKMFAAAGKDTGKEVRSLDIGAPVSAATANDDGTVVVTTEGSDKVRWYNAEGKKTRDTAVSASPSGMVRVGNERNKASDGDAEWRVAVLDAEQSTISDVDMNKQQFNAALRVGQGLGTASSGRRADGVLVASDPRKDQVLVYTFTDVIRHTEAGVTGPSPWAVLWDSARQVLWVSTTGDNKLTAYSLASGVPTPLGDVPTIADIRFMADGGDGALLLIAEDGTREYIAANDLPLGK